MFTNVTTKAKKETVVMMLDTGILQTANWPNLFSAADQVLPHLHCHPTTHLRAQATNWGNTLSITHPTETAREAGPCPQHHLESTHHLPTHNLSGKYFTKRKSGANLPVNELKNSKDIYYGFAYLSMDRYWNDFWSKNHSVPIWVCFTAFLPNIVLLSN